MPLSAPHPFRVLIQIDETAVWACKAYGEWIVKRTVAIGARLIDENGKAHVVTGVREEPGGIVRLAARPVAAHE